MNETQQQMLVIPANLAQGLHDYLSTRPMREVENMVVGVRQLKPLSEYLPEPEPAGKSEEQKTPKERK